MSIVELQDWAAVMTIAVGFGTTLTIFNRKFDGLRKELKADNAATRAELTGLITATRAELKADNAATRAELKADNATTRTELTGLITDLRREMKAEAAQVDSRLQTIEQRTYDIGSRLPAVNG